jgi:adenylate cyclase
LRYLFEDFVLDSETRELRRGAEAVPMTPQAFDLLDYLVRNRERVVSKDDLIAAVWAGRIVSDAALTTRINAARVAIGDSGEEQRLIKTLPRKGLRFVGMVREERGSVPGAVGASVETPRPALSLPDKPSIAVLAFANLSADPAQEYLADGIVEDIITELSRFSELFVIARNSSFQYKGKATDVRQVGRELGVRYVLEGSLRRTGDRLRISAQLIEAATGAHRWAERYDCRLEDIFTVQDEVVRMIVATLAAHVQRAETERTRAKPPNSWQVYDYYLQAVDAFGTFTSKLRVEDLYEARRLLQHSLSIDANYARSHALLATTYDAAWANPLDGDFLDPRVLDRALDLARKAVELDRNLPQAHAALGLVLTWKHRHDDSVAAFERATALNPNYVDWRFGFALIYAGASKRAIDAVQAYMRLDPFYLPVTSFVLAFAHYMLKQHAQALSLLQDIVAEVPAFRASHGLLAATYARLGQMDEARAQAAEVLRLGPGFTISGAGRTLSTFKDPEDDKHFFDGLRKAGLPE